MNTAAERDMVIMNEDDTFPKVVAITLATKHTLRACKFEQIASEKPGQSPISWTSVPRLPELLMFVLKISVAEVEKGEWRPPIGQKNASD